MSNLIGISGKIGSGKDTVGKIIQMLAQGIDSNKQIIDYVNGTDFTGFDYQIKKYADKLKDIVCLLIGCTREQLEDREFKEKGLGEEWDHWIRTSSWSNHIELVPNYVEGAELHVHKRKMTPRKLLQLLGTECGRSIIHPNIWVNALFSDYDNNFHAKKFSVRQGFEEPEYPNWIITDVRFPNEAQAIKDRGGIIIRVNREIDTTALQKGSVLLSDVIKSMSVEHHPSETALDDYKFDYVIDNNGSIEELINRVRDLIINNDR